MKLTRLHALRAIVAVSDIVEAELRDCREVTPEDRALIDAALRQANVTDATGIECQVRGFSVEGVTEPHPVAIERARAALGDLQAMLGESDLRLVARIISSLRSLATHTE